MVLVLLGARLERKMKAQTKIYQLVQRIVLANLFWLLAVMIATLLRYDGDFPSEKLDRVLLLGVIGGSLNAAVNQIFAKNFANYRVASLEEVFALTVSTSFVTIILTVNLLVFSFPLLPRSVPLVAGILALLIQFLSRLVISRKTYKTLFSNSVGSNTLIYGAGITGRQVAEQMLLKSKEFKPVGFLDDDPSKKNLKIFGRKIFGDINLLEQTVAEYDLKILVVAFSGIEVAQLFDIEKRCRSLSVTLKIIPNPFEIMARNLQLGDIATVSEEDLLGRRPIKPDESEIATFLSKKKILITGAGGSIGSEIARQVNRFNSDGLFLLDRDENALLSLQLSLVGDGLLANPNLILADIRDNARILQILDELRPDIVFHAAALKHLAILERFPQEAFKTNVVGTQNLIDSARKSNVKYFVNISTDKAADPISELGKTKLLTERQISAVSDLDKKYISVRFGNVIGSNGSFLNTFRYQIKSGGPVKVTHPEITRYFMTVSEAVHLVLQSVLIGESGETLILDMGNPVSIDLVAKNMIEASGKSIKIEYTGLRDGEKLHERLVGVNEKIYRGKHKDIMHTRVEPISAGQD
jgi:FlaA1/EpsC-like NDP-sugar epimerase